MTKIKNGDFIEIEYEGKLTDGSVFDTTDEDSAKKNGLHTKDMKYGSLIICVGESQLIGGLDKAVIDKEPGEYDFEFAPEDAFGKKNAKLIRLINKTAFTKEGINPYPGMQVTIDDEHGTVKTVTGGRIIVDFNHPLSGKEVKYHLKIKRIVTDNKEKLSAYINMAMGLKDEQFNIVLDDKKADITLDMELPDEITDAIAKKIESIVPLKVTITGKKTSEKKDQENTVAKE